MNAVKSDIAISSEIQTILDRHQIVARESEVTILHPNLGVTTVTPSVYAVYLATIKANYTIAFLIEINRRPAEAMAAYGYFASMIDNCDELPWFSDADVAHSLPLIEKARHDLATCALWMAEAGHYDLLD